MFGGEDESSVALVVGAIDVESEATKRANQRDDGSIVALHGGVHQRCVS